MTARELWSNIDRVIDSWLKERQSLILLMCAVDGLRDYTPQGTPVFVKVQAFCDVLVDYVSAGHFEIYEKLIQEAESFGDNVADLVESTFPKIQKSTQIALWFNDKYGSSDKCAEHLDALVEDLSRVAESLTNRFELEDRLIADIHSRHSERVA